ncbi:MAG: hypothetical protein WC683_06905 [bacterium]
MTRCPRSSAKCPECCHCREPHRVSECCTICAQWDGKTYPVRVECDGGKRRKRDLA